LRRFVVDASVAAKLFLPASTEPFAAEAVALFDAWQLGQVDLLVPDHFWAEVATVLWKATRQGRLTPHLAVVAIRQLREQNPPTTPCAGLVESALAIAIEHQRSVYDVLYVALAVRKAATLITADERLFNALAARFPVKWLGAFSMS